MSLRGSLNLFESLTVHILISNIYEQYNKVIIRLRDTIIACLSPTAGIMGSWRNSYGKSAAGR